MYSTVILIIFVALMLCTELPWGIALFISLLAGVLISDGYRIYNDWKENRIKNKKD